MKSKLVCTVLTLLLLLSACATAPQQDSPSDSADAEISELQTQFELANEQISMLRSENRQLQEQLSTAQSELEKRDSYIDDLNRELETIYRFGNQAGLPEQFRLTAYADELDMTQAITSLDPNGDIEEIRVYDLPAYSSVYTTIGANVYVEVMAKVIAVPTWGEDMGYQSSWYLVRTPGLTGIGQVVWIPEANLIPYTYENMYSIIWPVKLCEGAIYYRDKNMQQPVEKDTSWIEFFISEHLDNGISQLTFSGAGPVYVYTADLVYPEPSA